MTRNQGNDSSDRGHDARMRMAAGDEVFFKYYWPRLVRYLKTRAADTNLAEDVAADAMMAFMDQTAEILDIQVGTVKKHLSRGLEGLRQSQGIPATVKATRRISA